MFCSTPVVQHGSQGVLDAQFVWCRQYYRGQYAQEHTIQIAGITDEPMPSRGSQGHAQPTDVGAERKPQIGTDIPATFDTVLHHEMEMDISSEARSLPTHQKGEHLCAVR